MSNTVQVGPYNTFQEGQGEKHDNDHSQVQETLSSKVTKERWNHPRSNILKTLATFWSFLVMGANDSAYGVSSLAAHSPHQAYTNYETT
jgi:hypothetical protein